jgi:hypothetical protein
MANTSNNSARQTHVSPGIYTKETDLTYASKSLGITTLGVAGETVKGPAFQPITIENWRQFQQFFGGTNTDKFRGSQYPKYELPYIAQSYLKQSNQLEVCRVLGLSGVNAGPAWVITVKGKTGSVYNDMVLCVLRSRGEHKKAAFIRHATPEDMANGICNDIYEYDGIVYYADNVELEASKTLDFGSECRPSAVTEDGNFAVNVNNYGRFTIVVTTVNGDTKKYAVSLNPGEKNFILNVLGGDPEIGESEIYVEELYDVALQQLIERGEVTAINQQVSEYKLTYIVPKFADVEDILTQEEDTLTHRDVGKRFLYSSTESKNGDGNPLKVHIFTKEGALKNGEPGDTNGIAGHIYTVMPYTTSEGTREYYYGEIETEEEVLSTERNVDPDSHVFDNAVKVKSDDSFYVLATSGEGGATDVIPVTLDFNNYKEQYRYASTPWIVSEMKGDATNVELNRLFRFHTISDGNNANTEVKISIENISPENGTFDVIVRAFYDTDAAPVVYERYKGVDLIPGSQNYIALRIGSFDESYETKSNYITVEVNENDKTKASIPAGFLGYPVRNYNGVAIQTNARNAVKPFLQYNTNVDEDIRINKQYFGLSNLTGIDEDILRYKGVEAYDENPNGLTPGFHLDARIFDAAYKASATDPGIKNQKVSVDGIDGYDWVTVGAGNQTSFGIEPRIGDEATMAGTIYEDKRYRKFTLAFCGGFDGWDYYRTSRGNSDDFKYTKYKGKINKNSGIGTMVSVIKNPEAYGFAQDEKILNSDFYAYLSAYRQFANPKTIDINVFATPGIDYVNQNSLVGEVINMIEEERADSVYVVTTPDKPYGASDSESDMFTPTDAVWNLEDSNIDSNYTCSYYPWCKYYDEDNNKYIYLPPTRDVVRNFAYTDNTKYPWFAAAGWYRGEIEENGVRPKKSLKLGEQDTLYAGRLNFINMFAKEGMKIWGDKNMQERESVMNRISKRRLLLRIRKLCSIACIGLIFDPNDNTTKQSFESAVTPILDNIMSNRGIVDWKLEIDDSQEARDRLELPAKIFIKPTPNLEYITIDFTISNQGTTWDNI